MNQFNSSDNQENIAQCVEITENILKCVKQDIIIDKIQRMAEALLEKEDKVFEHQH